MPDFNERSEDAMKVTESMEALPLDKLVERANKALLDKEWPTASLLFQRVSLKATMLASHALEQEVNMMRRSFDGTQER